MSFTQREARGVIRKAVGRVPEGEEIRHLNIMPMMDMMTILLITYIAQAAASETDHAARSVSLPPIPVTEDIAKETTTLVISKDGIVAEGKPIAVITNGQVDCTAKEGGCNGRKITSLSQFLGVLRTEYTKKATAQGLAPDDPKLSELMIIADRTTPYRVLIEVMFSAKEPEAGYKHFRMIVEKSFPSVSGQP